MPRGSSTRAAPPVPQDVPIATLVPPDPVDVGDIDEPGLVGTPTALTKDEKVEDNSVKKKVAPYVPLLPPGAGFLCPVCKVQMTDEFSLCPDCTGAVTFPADVTRLGINLKLLDSKRQRDCWPQGYNVYIAGVEENSAGADSELAPGMALCGINGTLCRHMTREDAIARLKADAGKERTLIFTPLQQFAVEEDQKIEHLIEKLTYIFLKDTRVAGIQVDAAVSPTARGLTVAEPTPVAAPAAAADTPAADLHTASTDTPPPADLLVDAVDLITPGPDYSASDDFAAAGGWGVAVHPTSSIVPTPVEPPKTPPVIDAKKYASRVSRAKSGNALNRRNSLGLGEPTSPATPNTLSPLKMTPMPTDALSPATPRGQI